MHSIWSIVYEVRKTVHDSDTITYDDEQIVAVINNGIRFIRRTIADIYPEILISTAKGVLAPGDSSVELVNRPLRMIRVSAGNEVLSSVTEQDSDLIHRNMNLIYNNKEMIFSQTTKTRYKEKTLKATNFRHIPDDDGNGAPTMYYRTGLKTIHFWPVPQVETAYTIDTIDDIKEVTIDDDSPLLSDFDDFLLEYTSMRLSIGNEYDESQETQIMMNIYNQIRNLLAPPPPGIVVEGYWDRSVRHRGGYW